MAKKRQEYMGFESVSQWLDALATKSKETVKQYLDDLIYYCDWARKTPDQLKQERKQQLKSKDIDVQMTAEKLLNRYVGSGARPQNATRRAVAAIKSFYNCNFIPLTGRVATPKQIKEKEYRCPTVEDVRKMLEGANLRDRAILLTLFQTGLRESSLVLLKRKHIREIFENKVPAHVGLRAKELKGAYSGVESHTFLGRDAVEAIKKYLDWRERVKGERLTDDSFLFARSDAIGEPLFDQALIRIVRTACERAGIEPFSPHDFRRAFQTNLEAAGVPANWVKKMTGHKLSGEENPYSIPKIEQLREAYMKAEPKLSITTRTETAFDRVKREVESLRERLKLPDKEFQKQLQQVYPNLKPYDWFSPKPQREATEEEIKAYEEAMREYDRQRLKNEILEELGLTKDKKDKKTITNGNGRFESKIVLEKELTQYLDRGWDFVASLNHKKYLVRRELGEGTLWARESGKLDRRIKGGSPENTENKAIKS